METRYKPRGFPQRLGSLRLPLFPQPRRRYYLPAINLGVGPFYSIKVGSFYVVKVTEGWDELGDRLEILWGPDYQGRHDLILFKGEVGTRYFKELPKSFSLPIVDKRQEIESLLCR